MVQLSTEDKNLIAKAISSFGEDFRYLESILIAAHQRRAIVDKKLQAVA